MSVELRVGRLQLQGADVSYESAAQGELVSIEVGEGLESKSRSSLSFLTRKRMRRTRSGQETSFSFTRELSLRRRRSWRRSRM